MDKKNIILDLRYKNKINKVIYLYNNQFFYQLNYITYIFCFFINFIKSIKNNLTI